MLSESHWNFPAFRASYSRNLLSRSASITTTLHQIGWLTSRNCKGERSGGKLSYKLACGWEGIPNSIFIPTVVVILAA